MISSYRQKLTPVITPILGWLWILSFWYFGLVLLLPLMASHKLREKYFVFFYKFIDVIWVDSFEKTRQAALSVLVELDSHHPELRKQGALRVLEVSAGTGVNNLKYIKRPLKYTNVDPNRQFEPLFQEELRKNPKIEHERWVQCDGEDMSELEGKFDVVLPMHIFYSVKNPLKVIMESNRLLVKGGYLIYLEVVAYHQGTWQKLLQDVVTPIWKFLACNFHVNRECHQDLIKGAGFSNGTANYMYLDMPVGMNSHAYGQAVA